jgi:uncharacterized phage protein (TIGR01671 family)
MILKFRAWDKEFKEMVQVNALVLDEQVIKATYKNGNVVKEDMKNYDLMLSTGIKDKAGNEIFEGDILITNAHASIVSFGEYTYFEDADTEVTEVGFYLSYLNVSPATYSPFEKFFWEKCQVIGNIYENELDLIMYEVSKFNKELGE